MKVPAIQHLRQRLAANETALGLWVTLESPSITEMAVALGMDWVVIDAEHGHSRLDAAGVEHGPPGGPQTALRRLAGFRDAGAPHQVIPELHRLVRGDQQVETRDPTNILAPGGSLHSAERKGGGWKIVGCDKARRSRLEGEGSISGFSQKSWRLRAVQRQRLNLVAGVAHAQPIPSALAQVEHRLCVGG